MLHIFHEMSYICINKHNAITVASIYHKENFLMTSSVEYFATLLCAISDKLNMKLKTKTVMSYLDGNR